MDRDILVKSLKELFLDQKKTGIKVDSFGLAPAYEGVVRNSYVLGISAPGMKGSDYYEKADVIIDLLFAYIPENLRKMIDRVRVYESDEELRSTAQNDFDRDGYDIRKPQMDARAQVFEMT